MAGLTPTAVLRFLNSRLDSVVHKIEISDEEMIRVLAMVVATIGTVLSIIAVVELSLV